MSFSLDTLEIWSLLKKSKSFRFNTKIRKGSVLSYNKEYKIKYSLFLGSHPLEKPHAFIQIVKTSSGKVIYAQVIMITSTPCNFGSERLWFICPYCNKRLGVLHTGNYKDWGCMKCIRADYLSRQLTPRLLREGIIRSDVLPRLLTQKAKNIKRVTWRGKNTRKAKKFIEYCQSIGVDWRSYLPVKRSKEREMEEMMYFLNYY